MGRSKHTVKKSSKKEKSKERSAGLGVRVPRRHKPGYRAKREVKQQQKKTNLLLKKKPFRELVKEITEDIADDPAINCRGIRFVRSAMEILQEMSEFHLLNLFELARQNAHRHKKKRISADDLEYVSRLRYPQIEKT